MAVAENRARRQRLGNATRVSHTIGGPVLRSLPTAFAAAAAALVGVLVIALLSGEYRRVPASGPPFVTGDITDAARTLGENLLVLLLYTMGNVAAATVARRQPKLDAQPPRMSRDFASQLRLIVVIGLLMCVALRQAYTLGHGLAGFAGYFYVSRWRLWLGVLPHALPELTAIFLPVAVWLFARRHGRQQDLRALTIAAVLTGVVILAAAALIEVYVSPKAFRTLTCIGEREGFKGGGNCQAEPQECSKLTPAEFESRYHIHLSPTETDGRRRCAS